MNTRWREAQCRARAVLLLVRGRSHESRASAREPRIEGERNETSAALPSGAVPLWRRRPYIQSLAGGRPVQSVLFPRRVRAFASGTLPLGRRRERDTAQTLCVESHSLGPLCRSSLRGTTASCC